MRVHAVALNPVDALYVSYPLGSSGRTVGSDFSGIVAVSRSAQLRVGERVAGFLQGACSTKERPGAFAEYLVCPTDLVWRVPDSVSDEEAATISLCALTAAQALFYRLGLPPPFAWPGGLRSGDHTPGSNTGADGPTRINFFTYGASTSVGMYAAQLVRRSAEVSGMEIRVIGAASKARFQMLQTEPYRYDTLVDYRDADWAQQVRKATGGQGVDFAYDCISEGSTVRMVSGILREGERMAVVRSKEGGAWVTDGVVEGVEPIYGAVWEGLGFEIQYQNLVVPTSPDARAFAVAFYRWLSDGGRIWANPVRLMPGALERIAQDGFALLGPGTMQDRKLERTESWMRPISAEKLVYKLS